MTHYLYCLQCYDRLAKWTELEKVCNDSLTDDTGNELLLDNLWEDAYSQVVWNNNDFQ